MHFDRRTENLLANLRGLPENSSKSTMRDSKPLKNILEAVLKQLQIEQPKIEQLLMQNWKKVMGDRFAHRSAPQRIIDGKRLVVFVGNSTLKQEMEFEKRRMLNTIKSLPGCEGINELVFKHS